VNVEPRNSKLVTKAHDKSKRQLARETRRQILSRAELSNEQVNEIKMISSNLENNNSKQKLLLLLLHICSLAQLNNSQFWSHTHNARCDAMKGDGEIMEIIIAIR